MAATTIKVSPATRDLVNDIGARTGQTADQVVAGALDSYSRALFWREYAEAATAVAADSDLAAHEAAELRIWDRTRLDGLDRA